MERKKLFSVPGSGNTAKDMLVGAKPKQPKEETKEILQEQVPEVKKEVKTKQVPVATEKKKSNRGRKRKYAEGEVIKLTALVDTHLSHTLKVLAKDNGTTVKDVMTHYLEEWIEENPSLENAYTRTKTKKYTGFSVIPDLRDKFAQVCIERKKTQSYVMESLYQKAIESMKK